MCPRGDLNPETRAFSPVLRLSTQGGEIPCFGVSCGHASGRAPAPVKRFIRCGLREPRGTGVTAMTSSELPDRPQTESEARCGYRMLPAPTGASEQPWSKHGRASRAISAGPSGAA
jgi:hypothetical protein